MPRATYLPFPFQITQGADKILIAYGFSNAGRTIHLDEVEPPGVVSWMGHSVGRWEGDTLVVEVTELMDQTWFDRSGNFHSGELRVVERYTPITPYHLQYEATIHDPAVFTEPWTLSLPLYQPHGGERAGPRVPLRRDGGGTGLRPPPPGAARPPLGRRLWPPRRHPGDRRHATPDRA